MWTRNEIAEAVSHLGVRAVELDGDAARAVESRAEAGFAKPGYKPLWERILHSEDIQDADAWRSIESFVVEPVTLLVRDAQGICAFRFEGGPDLVATLGECPRFQFYVLDDLNHFLLAFNDHDFLIGCGTAAEWVCELRAKQEQRDALREPRYACMCCGYLTLLEPPPGTFDICKVCFWEDDQLQALDPDYRGGANTVSLREAQENFRKLRVSEPRFRDHVRPPLPEEIPASHDAGPGESR